MTRRYRHYAVLGMLFIVAAAYQVGNSIGVIHDLRLGTQRARAPFSFGFQMRTTTGIRQEAKSAGVHLGDELEEVAGRRFTGYEVLRSALARIHPGDLLPVTVRQQNGNIIHTSINLEAEWKTPPKLGDWLITLTLQLALPILCLGLGFWVAAIRPSDPLAWLLLGLMMSFSQLATDFQWEWPGRTAALTWTAALGSTWMIWMFLFGVFFPEPAGFERKRPWLKWLLIVPLVLLAVVGTGFVVGRELSFEAIAWMQPLLMGLVHTRMLTIPGMVAIGAFFYLLAEKSGTASTPDARRRLTILWMGAAVSLTPAFVAALISLIRGREVFRGLPQWFVILALLDLLVFPITLAHVIVVQRALDVRVVIRQGLQYAFATGGIRALRYGIGVGVWLALAYLWTHSGVSWRVVIIVMGVGLGLGLRRMFEHLKKWTDRRFFRDAYNAEQILSDLSEKVRTIVETRALLETVASRIAESLHVTRVAVLLDGSGPYRPACALGYRATPEVVFPESAFTVRWLQNAHEPVRVYFDDPNSWVNRASDISEEERKKLVDLQSELLLPLSVKDKLLGFISLGQKRSDEPYSGTDLRLLKSLASQTGLALENARLTAAIAEEVAQRERLNREVEIAREVQERLFPQKLAAVPGLDYGGKCRPALGVGGDYYDFLALPGEKLGVAIGDVSGKGIAAALMMASLQASLRGEAVRAPEDLAKLMGNVNRLVYEASSVNRYATFFYAQYEPSTRRLTYVNAGHNPPIVFSRSNDGWKVTRLEVGGVVVGMLPSFPYQQATVTLAPGDLLVAFTDGISEAMNPADEEWGEERMMEAAKDCDGLNATDTIARIMTAADAFAAGAKRHDDMTLVILRTLPG